MAFLKFLSGCAFFCLILINLGFCQDFGYEGKEGPDHWGDKYAKCVGKHQSPIDIDASNVIPRKFQKLIFEKFDKTLDLVSLKNNGHTVSGTIKKGNIPTIHGGPLTGMYKLDKFHFHWGPNDSLGSENKIDHHSFPVELHIVMYNTNYEGVDEAINFGDGLTVLSFLFLATDTNNPHYDRFEEGLRKVVNMSATTEISNFVSLNDFTTTNRDAYFTYEGSLTTPPCSEVVIWIEFINTIPLSKEQINNFRTLITSSGRLTHNYRPIQDIHDREIFKNSTYPCTPKLYTVILVLFITIFEYYFI